MLLTQLSTGPTTTCKSCGTAVPERYCSICGQAAQLTRLDRHYISHEVLHLLHFEKGFFYTVKSLLLRPGDSIREFIRENRTKHMKPVAFLILTSLLYTLVSHWVGAAKTGERHFESSKYTDALMSWTNTHYGYANIMMSGVTALFVYLFFRKYRYNLFEITVLMCFVVGQGMLLMLLISCLHGALDKLSYGLLSSFGVFVYAAWAIGQFFDGKKVASYAKAVTSYFLGYLVFYSLIVAAGLAADLVMGNLGAH